MTSWELLVLLLPARLLLAVQLLGWLLHVVHCLVLPAMMLLLAHAVLLQAAHLLVVLLLPATLLLLLVQLSLDWTLQAHDHAVLLVPELLQPELLQPACQALTVLLRVMVPHRSSFQASCRTLHRHHHDLALLMLVLEQVFLLAVALVVLGWLLLLVYPVCFVCCWYPA